MVEPRLASNVSSVNRKSMLDLCSGGASYSSQLDPENEDCLQQADKGVKRKKTGHKLPLPDARVADQEHFQEMVIVAHLSVATELPRKSVLAIDSVQEARALRTLKGPSMSEASGPLHAAHVTALPFAASLELKRLDPSRMMNRGLRFRVCLHNSLNPVDRDEVFCGVVPSPAK